MTTVFDKITMYKTGKFYTAHAIVSNDDIDGLLLFARIQPENILIEAYNSSDRDLWADSLILIADNILWQNDQHDYVEGFYQINP